MPIIRTIHASEDETVEIQWRLKDNSTFVKRYTVPPKNTREYYEEKEAAERSEK